MFGCNGMHKSQRSRLGREERSRSFKAIQRERTDKRLLRNVSLLPQQRTLYSSLSNILPASTPRLQLNRTSSALGLLYNYIDFPGRASRNLKGNHALKTVEKQGGKEGDVYSFEDWSWLPGILLAASAWYHSCNHLNNG